MLHRDFLVVLMTLPAAILLLRRLGLSPLYLALLPLSLVLPLLGHMLFAIALAIRPWPRLPALPKPPKREKMV